MSGDSLDLGMQEFVGEVDFSGNEEEGVEQEVSSRILTRDEASKCLCNLGKIDSGLGYAYLSIKASDMGLTDISVIPCFRNVIYVDVSGNRLTPDAMSVLTSMTFLLMLQADRNGLPTGSMEPMLYLQVLTLNRNNITNTTGISHKLLECLELNYNGIKNVSLNPYLLKNLKILELRGNAISGMGGIYCPTLVRLYLAENWLTIIEGLETLVNLSVLHIRANKIEVLDGFENPHSCPKLTYLNLRNNCLRGMDEIRKLRYLVKLESLIIMENNLDMGEESAYRIPVLRILPNLKRIDKDPVLEDERVEASDILQ
ncbi:leucine-rich repeat-containing protein 23 [Cephus cinctus]|uniref:Leucine-rich repeat-containing protein 23 n=1 Tax=Cephus cinctus TaxID=211228 RepID=A0AAJ7FHL1_CEPCN|nr:leucine-rich repeat-containing protein 23 [Cephus cinctus]